MARVETWFPGFVVTHTGRFPRHDWDQATVEFWDGLQTLFIRHGVTEADALEASARLFETPPGFIGDHPPRLLEAVKAIWRERQTTIPMNADIARRREADVDANARFDRAAELNWIRTADAEKAVWRDLVRRKLPELCERGDWWCEGLAKAWAYDPTFVTGDPPSRPGPPPKRGEPRTPFVEVPQVQPQAQPRGERLG